MQPLLTLDQAAEQLNVPTSALRAEAEQHGLLVRIGRNVRIDPATIPELIKKCRSQPKGHVSTGARAEINGSYKTLADQKLQQAQRTADSLKKGSRSISKKKTGLVVPLVQKG